MKKLCVLFAIAALSSIVAQADDKGTEFRFGGEIREQFDYDSNPSFLAAAPISENHWEMRNQFHVNAISSDKLQGYINLLHYSIWGAGVPSNLPPTVTNGTTTQLANNPGQGAVTSANALQVNEAWVWWKVSDMFSLRVGRQGIDYGDGLEFSRNDWLMTPYSVDALMGRFSWDFLDLDLGGGSLLNLMTPLTAGTGTGMPGAGGNQTTLETNFYGLYAGFKTLPEFLKKADAFLVQINSDNMSNAAQFVPPPLGFGFGPFAPSMSGSTPWNLTSFGIHVKGDVAQIDYRLDGVIQSGAQRNGASLGNNINFNTNMIDAQVGYTFPEFMRGHVYVDYHMDSGQDLSQVSASSYTNAQYQPLFYDQHSYAGAMDVFGFGNLTNIRVGLTLQPMEDTDVGVEVNLASRTQSNGSYQNNTNNSFEGYFTLPTVGAQTAASQSAAGKNLGTEIDVWAKHTYGHGFAMLGQIGFLSLGNYYNNSVQAAANPGSAMQFVAQAKYGF